MAKKVENPFKKNSRLYVIYRVLISAQKSKPLTMAEIIKRVRLPGDCVRTLVAAMRNPYHNAALRRTAWRMGLKDGGYRLVKAKVEKNAKRKSRGI